jgi:hypothetical protein
MTMGASGFEELEDDENGLAGALPLLLVANGFENGFEGIGVLAPFCTPKREAPILLGGFT